MASERTTQTETTHQTATNPDSKDPWEDLEMTVPNDRDHVSIIALVECTLVELTHEDVGAVFVEQEVGRMKRTQYVAVDDVGEQFQKRYFDERLGAYETTISREEVRDELIFRLTGCAGREWTGRSQARFVIKPVQELRLS